MSPLPSGNIAPALLVPHIANQTVLLPGATVIITAFPPTADNVGAPPALVLDSVSAIVAFGRTSDFNTEARTILAPGSGLGDLLVMFHGMAGYAGEANVILRTPALAAWESTGGGINQSSDTSTRTSSIRPRISTNNAEDNCFLGSPGPFPSYGQMVRFKGNIWPFGLASINSNATLGEDLSDSDFRREGLFATNPTCLRLFNSVKRATATESSNTVTAMPGFNLLGTAGNIDNDFDQGLVAAWGWDFDAGQNQVSLGDFTAPSFTSETFTVAARLKSGDS